MKRPIMLALTIVMFGMLAFSSASFADAAAYKAKVTSDNYAARAGWRLVHGVFNLALSPLEIVTEPVNTFKQRGNLAVGLANGVIKAGKFAVLGAWDVATFWVPGDSGKQIAVQECVMADISGKS